MHFVLLPGMDGTGELFEPLIEALPAGSSVTVVRYPAQGSLSLVELATVVAEAAPIREPYCLIAESFSGPIAIRFASEHPSGLQALVLCATFCANPLPRNLRWIGRLATPKLFAIPIPSIAVRRLCVSGSSPNELVELVRNTIRSVPPEVLAGRARLIQHTDVSEDLKLVQAPMLYLQGSRDQIVGDRGWKQIQSVLPAIRCETLDGPHLLLQCLPRETADAICNFVDGSQ